MGFKTSSTRFTQAQSAQSSDLVAYNNATSGGPSISGTVLSSSSVITTVKATPGQSASSSTTSSGGGASITSIVYTDVNYNTLTANAASTTFGYVRILGSGFASGANVFYSNSGGTLTNVTANTTFVSSGEIRANVPSTTAGNYTLYVFNPSGSAAIYYSGIAFEPYPLWNASSLAFSGTTISGNVATYVTSTAGIQPITFSLAAGNTLPSGLTLYSNGAILGNITQSNISQTYYANIVATDLYNEATTSNISLTVNLADPSFKYTTLLLNGETNTNTYAQDASTNNFALTVSGAANSNRFSPLWGNGYYGVSFDGSTGYMNSASSSTVVGTGDFTIEFWAYINAAVSSAAVFVDMRASGSATAPLIYMYTSNVLYYAVGLTNQITGPTLVFGQWYHIAVSRASGSTKMFVNGTQVGSTYSDTNNYVAQASRPILGSFGDTVANRFNGYLSNLRIVNQALYTTNFTPSTTPLTAVANTTFLACQSPNFTDVGPNGFPLTITGTVKVVPNQPFGIVPSSSTAVTNNAGYYSAQFDGSTGYLTVPSNAAFNFGSGAFTIEFWAYLLAFPTTNNAVNVFQMGNHTGGGNFLEVGFINSSGTTVFSYNLYNTAYKVQMTTNFSTLNAWTHFAVIFTGTTVYTSINGVLSAGTSYSGSDAPSGQTVLIGYELSSPLTYFSGFISNLRVLKGTALYTTNFTPSTTPLTAIANTSLLTLQNSTIVDNSTNAFTLTPNGKVIVSQNQPFASPTTTSTATTPSVYGSSLFDGSSSYIALGGQSAFAFGTGNFTIECWFYTTTASSTQEIYSSQTNGSYVTAPDIYIQSSKFYVQVASSNPINGSGPTTVVSNTWYHVALVKNGSTTTLYVNGTYEASFSDSNTYVIGANRPVIGVYGYNGTSYPFAGYITNLRVIKGTAVYTNNFLPPNQPLTAVANTSLLTLQYKNGINNNIFQDDSVNNFVLTRTGTPTQGTFTPFSQTGWSNYFDGSSGYLTIPATPFSSIGTGDFTVEAWVYIIVAASGQRRIWSFQSSGSATVFNIYQVSGGQFAGELRSSAGTSDNTITGTTVAVTGTWYHVALTRASGTLRLFVNGTIEASATTQTQSLGSGVAEIGGSAANSNYFPGYISNFRVVVGTAVYTSNFTPSTTPLTAISGTALLTCQSNRFLDNSSNAATLTPTGTVQVQAFSPFAPVTTYSSTAVGGSMYFNGTTDYLSIPYNPQFNLGAYSIWTVEAWVYLSSTSGNYDIIAQGATTWRLTVLAGVYSWGFNNGTNNTQTGGTLYPNQWYHLAVTCDGTGSGNAQVKMYVNGVYASSGGYTPSSDTSSALYVGVNYNSGSPTWFMNGYIANPRVLGGVALYTGTGSFTPPTAPPSPTKNTNVLVLGTNTGIQDVTGKNNIVTVGNAKTQSSTVKYGTGAMYFDGSSYLTSPATVNILGSANFTIEGWFNFNAVGTNNYEMFARENPSYDGFRVVLVTTAKVTVQISSDGSTYSTNFTGGTALSTGTWYHIAVVRNGSTITLYINGVSDGTGTFSSTVYSSSSFWTVASRANGGTFFIGYIDDFRVTTGIARYTANFTPPTLAFLGQ